MYSTTYISAKAKRPQGKRPKPGGRSRPAGLLSVYRTILQPTIAYYILCIIIYCIVSPIRTPTQNLSVPTVLCPRTEQQQTATATATATAAETAAETEAEAETEQKQNRNSSRNSSSSNSNSNRSRNRSRNSNSSNSRNSRNGGARISFWGPSAPRSR